MKYTWIIPIKHVDGWPFNGILSLNEMCPVHACVKYERKKPSFVFHCKFACAIIIDNINHYSKWLYIYHQIWRCPGIRMHTICLIKCILSHIYPRRLYVIIRRPGVETYSTLLALCQGNHLRPMDSPRNRPLWPNFGGFSWANFWKQNSPVVGDFREKIWDAMTPHDVTEIYNLIHILKM